MFGIEITTHADKTQILCPYSSHFVAKIKQLGGKWDKPYWAIAPSEEPQARALLRQCFGTDGTPEPTVTLLVSLDHTDAEHHDSFFVGPIEVLRKFGRDSTPKLGTGCVVVEGQLLSQGGSRNNPAITYKSGTVIKISGFPAGVAQSMTEESPHACQILAAVQPASTLTAEEMSLAEILRNLDPGRLALILQSIK